MFLDPSGAYDDIGLPGVGNVVQVAQAGELLTDVLSGETLPTILVGDFNSDHGGVLATFLATRPFGPHWANVTE
jgi:hypothetical protein